MIPFKMEMNCLLITLYGIITGLLPANYSCARFRAKAVNQYGKKAEKYTICNEIIKVIVTRKREVLKMRSLEGR